MNNLYDNIQDKIPVSSDKKIKFIDSDEEGGFHYYGPNFLTNMSKYIESYIIKYCSHVQMENI